MVGNNIDDFIDNTSEFIDGFLQSQDESLIDSPDGAWFASMVSASYFAIIASASCYNIEIPEGIDGYDILMNWIERNGA